LSWLDFVLSLIRPRRPAPVPAPPVVEPIGPQSQPMGQLNRARLLNGVPALPESTMASKAAKVQSDWQAGRGWMGHDGPPGLRTSQARLIGTGETFTACGEIVAECSTFAEAVQLWLESPGEDPRGITHRKILLDPSWTHAGVAMTGRYATAVFFR
jgi:uncharacterized protein YkwD